LDPKTCCLPYEDLCQYLHTNPETFRRAWKELPHFIAPGTEGYNLKAARFDLSDLVGYLKQVGKAGRQQQAQVETPAAKKYHQDNSQPKKWRSDRFRD
jgi:hypothetical protein